MSHSPSQLLSLMLAAGLAVFSVSNASARGGAAASVGGTGAGFASGFGGRGTVAPGIRGRGGNAAIARNGYNRGRLARNRFAGGAGYFPSAPFGAFGGVYGAEPAYGGPDRPPIVDTAPRTITVIKRGPAFGEPGYVSRPVIYRLTPAAARTQGTRRFKVERLEF